MPGQPSRSQVHIDSALTTFGTAYLENQKRFIADRAFGKIRVNKQTGKYWVIDKDYWMRQDVTARGPGAESAGSGYKVSNAGYVCDVFALHTMVDEQTRKNADAPLNLDQQAVQFITNALALKKEQDFVAAFIGASAFSTTSTPGTTWDDVTSTPIEDVRAQFNVISEKTGHTPNLIIAGAEITKRLVDHPDVVDRIKYSAGPGNPAVVSENALAALFGVERYLTHYASYNSAAEGATGSYDYLGNSGKNALLCYADMTPGWMSATAAICFEWMPLEISSWYKDDNRADKVEGQMAYDFKVIGDDLAVEFTSAVAS